MAHLVTVAIPVYKRFHLLPEALAAVAAQDYPAVDLLISDNGENGFELEALVREHYPRPFRMRRNDRTVPVMSQHFNQMLASARGEYFVLLCDDDVINPSFVSTLAAILDGDPATGLALPYVEVLDEAGRPQPQKKKKFPPETFTGTEFARMWASGDYCFWNFVTVMARTQEMIDVGGYPSMPTGDDDAVALKLSLGRKVGFSRDAVFGNRWYESSHGLAISPWELAADIRKWLEFLRSDPTLRAFGERAPAEWAEVRELMVERSWRTYRSRWKTMYRKRMGRLAWVRAGFALPFIPAYYRWVSAYLLRLGLSYPKRLIWR